MALVLVNLGFVAITDAARWTWLGPLLLLTLASPWLAPFAGRKSVRACWNMTLVGAFAVLLNHATAAGVANLLEDGLMLAALCQVHLLNNLREGQKPDLLFFNSFLIAVVTSFLSIEVQYFALFLLYAPVLVIAMQRQVARRVVWSGLWRSAVVVALTLLVFAMWPRDFRRKGLLGERLRQARDRGAEVDFSNQVLLDRSGDVTVSDRVVMRVRGPRDATPRYWRGATMVNFRGIGWAPWAGMGKAAWRRRNGAWVVPAARDPSGPLRVKLVGGKDRLFLPIEAARVMAATRGPLRRISAQADGVLRTRPVDRPLTYEVWITRAPYRSPRLWVHTALDRRYVPPQALATAQRLREGRSDRQFVEAVRDYLSSRYRYLAPGAEGGARDLSQFLSGRAPGHCEFFATAFVLMVRSQNVPARLVTGYRSEEWENGELVIRARDAHAWAEVLDADAGWYTVDATSSVVASAEKGGLWRRVRRVASSLWNRVTGFTERDRAVIVAWLRTVPGRLLWPAVAVLVIGVVVLLRRRRREPKPIRDYRRALRRHKARLKPGETPRQLAARVPELAGATAAHERARYEGAR